MNETIHRLRSVHLGNERTIWIREPADGPRPQHLTIFLDAEIYRDHVGALAVIEHLAATHAIAPSLFVFVSMQSEEARWRECPCYPPFARFLVDELLPWIETLHPSGRTGGQRVLAGLSYTGLAAAYAAGEAKGAFGKVIAQSGSFWWNGCWLVEEFRKKDECVATDFYLDVGAKETKENVRHRDDAFQATSQIDAVKRFRDVLIEKGHRVKYVEFDGGHEARAWGLTLPHALRWALPVDLSARVTLVPATSDDLEALVALRIAAMRESLERVGRFDPVRARERLVNSFHPEHTQFVLLDGARIGFCAFRPMTGLFRLDHLYILPSHHAQGIGSHVLRQLLKRSDAQRLPVHVGALKESASNRFYIRHGFLKESEDAWDVHYVRPSSS